VLILFEGHLSAETVYHGLMEHGYITRWLPGQGLPDALRITIGTQEQMDEIAGVIRTMATSHERGAVSKVAIIGLGLLGGSIGLALREQAIATTGYDRNPDTRARAAERGLVGHVADTARRR
jgi:hypothetical protein